MGRKTWLDERHPDWLANAGRWDLIMDHYQSLVTDSDRVKKYLVKRSQAENPDAYEERCKIADYTNHFATVVDSLAGLLFSVEDNAERKFEAEGVGLGDPKDPTTDMYVIWRDADGQGTNWPTVFKQLATMLIHSQVCWPILEAGPEGGMPSLVVLPPSAVVNWRYEGGILVEALTVEYEDILTSLKKKLKSGEDRMKERYVLYRPDGWERWRVSDEKKGQLEMVNEGAYHYEDSQGRPQLPIFRAELPMGRPVGYALAKKANAIFNRESDRDMHLRTGSYPYLVLKGTDTAVKTMIKDITGEGTRILQEAPDVQGQGHRFIGPPGEGAEVATSVLERKVAEYYVTAFQMYGDTAREKTATEVKQDVASGVGAFLQMLRAAVDDSENGALWRLEQAIYPDKKDHWFTASVERSKEYTPIDSAQIAEKLGIRYVGDDTHKTVPVGRDGLIAVVKQLAQYDNITVNEAQLEASVDLFMLRSTMDSFAILPIPAEVRADMAIKQLLAMGYLDPEAITEMADGEKLPTVDVIRAQALELAQQEDQAKRDRGGGFGF